MFYKPNNKIIIVDDAPDDLLTLSNIFHKNGVGCKTFLYDSDFDTPLKGVRIAFFDIEINPSGGGSDSQKFNSLALAIKQYIDKNNGPFALIFWTKNKQDINGLISYIGKVHNDCPRPFLVSHIDKGDFAINPEEKLEMVLNDKTLELLFDFENKASDSATKTIDQIYNIIPQKDSWGENNDFNKNFEKILSKISTSALGFEHAKKTPDKAVYEALIPILNYHIVNNNKGSKWASYLSSLLNARSYKDIEIPDNFNISILNSIFHVDESEIIFPLDVRGAVIELDKAEPEFENTYGNKFDSWFVSFLPIIDKQKKRNIRAESKLIAIEISSSCDFSQNKKRLNKYLLGVIISPIKKDEVKDQSDCAFLVGTFYNGKEFQIWANLNYVFAAKASDNKLNKSLFILKKEIMDMIGNRYANHVSRIGITSF